MRFCRSWFHSGTDVLKLTMSFYQHQQQVIDEKDRPDRLRFGNLRGTGSGKTRTTVAVAEGITLVICPKTQWQDQIWPKEWAYQNRNPDDLFCLSNEQFKKAVDSGDLLSICGGVYPTTVIIDEAHKVTGVRADTRQLHLQEIVDTSQIFDALLRYLRVANPKRVHPLTATPASSPMSLFALGIILGRNFDFYKFREAFYYKTKLRGYERWLPKFRRKAFPGSKPEIKEFIERERRQSIELAAKTKESLGYTGTLNDWFDVPDQVFKVHEVGTTTIMEAKYKELKKLYPDPLVQAGKRQRLEQGIFDKYVRIEGTDEVEKVTELIKENKADAIEQYMIEFGKVIVFCRYTAQIEMFKERFEKDYKVLTLTGQTKDRQAVLEEARNSEECLFIAQCQISAGWELPDYPCMIFASLNYSFVDYDQAKGRILRANKLKKNLYVFLIAGDGDRLVKEVVDEKQIFSEAKYADRLTAGNKLA